MENYKNYIIFILGYDLLNKTIINSDYPEVDIAYEECSNIADEFMKDKEYLNSNESLYESLDIWVYMNKDKIKSKFIYSHVESNGIKEDNTKNNQVAELLQDYKAQEEYNLYCYTDPKSWESKAKDGYEKEYKAEQEKIKLLEEMISDEIEIKHKQKVKKEKER